MSTVEILRRICEIAAIAFVIAFTATFPLGTAIAAVYMVVVAGLVSLVVRFLEI